MITNYEKFITDYSKIIISIIKIDVSKTRNRLNSYIINTFLFLLMIDSSHKLTLQKSIKQFALSTYYNLYNLLFK